MAIDDTRANAEAGSLKNSLQNNDAAGLHEKLIQAAGQYDKDSFKKIVSSLNEMNKKDQAGSEQKLPSLEISNDCFGFGSTEQIVMKDSNGKKMEVFETPEHRQKEAAEAQKQGQGGLNLDFGRLYQTVFSSEWQGNRTDFQTDSSVSWKTEANGQQANQAPVIRDYSNNGNQIGGYDYGPGARRINSEEELQQILNNPPKGYNNGFRRGY